MKYLMMFVYLALLGLAVYYGCLSKYDRACFDLLIAYGVRWGLRDEYGE